ncbi:MAG: alkaline phosphatase [Bacteroidales bacterium]|nr:alkaline phosphatase [Bacteroidales bacterium]
MKKLTSLLVGLLLAFVSVYAQNSPKYIFYFIGDGMGHGAVMGADTYLRLVKQRPDSLLMMQFPVAGMITTYSANTPVTDSAAAGTALATGHKTKNNMLGVAADSTAVKSIAENLAERGYGIGLVTNVCPDDATPAAFYAHVPNRNMWYDIAMQFADSPVNFLAGAKLRGAMNGNRYTGLYEQLSDKGISIVRGVENLSETDANRIILLNTDSIPNQLGFTIDKPDGNSLAQFTKAAINHLEKTSPEKFFIMVEGGNIDHAGHDNDGPTVVREVLEYDAVLRQAYDFYLRHPDETLIIVTSDHETGGLSIGQASTRYNQFPQIVDRQHKSKAAFSQDCYEIIRSGKQISWEEMKNILRQNLGFFSESKLSQDQEQRLKNAFENTFINKRGKDNVNLYSSYPEFADVAYTIQNEIAGYGFTTPKHTGNPVPVFAIGVGSEKFGRPMDNTDIPKLILELTQK